MQALKNEPKVKSISLRENEIRVGFSGTRGGRGRGLLSEYCGKSELSFIPSIENRAVSRGVLFKNLKRKGVFCPMKENRYGVGTVCWETVSLFLPMLIFFTNLLLFVLFIRKSLLYFPKCTADGRNSLRHV